MIYNLIFTLKDIFSKNGNKANAYLYNQTVSLMIINCQDIIAIVSKMYCSDVSEIIDMSEDDGCS